MYYIVINPVSKSGRGAKIWSSIEAVLKEKKIPYQAFLSERAGHVIEIVRKLTSPLKDTGSDAMHPLKLIILGGDGTFNEALQGIADFEKVHLGYIPTGSSNDLARDLYPLEDASAVLNRILSCKEPVPMDIGYVTYDNVPGEFSKQFQDGVSRKRYFAVGCGIGFDAAVCEESFSSRFKNLLNKAGLGKLTYLTIALKQLITARKVSCNLYPDEKEPIHLPRFLFVASMIHQYEGGGFKFCPGANIHDGLLDICVIGDISKLRALMALPTGYTGKHYRFKGIHRYSAKTLKIVAAAPLWIHTDGEVSVKANEITIACEQDKLQMLL